jgi:hypothetical protein
MKILMMLFVLAAVVVSACSAPGRSNSSPASTPTATADPPTDPYAIPAVITPSYVDTVFAALNHVNGDAVRSLIAAGQLSDFVRQRLRAIYNDPLFAVELKVFNAGLTLDRSNLRNPIGDRSTIVNTLVSASPTCIFVETSTNLSAVEIHSTGSAVSEYWELQHTQPGADPDRLNPTPWSFALNDAFETKNTMTNQCT